MLFKKWIWLCMIVLGIYGCVVMILSDNNTVNLKPDYNPDYNPEYNAEFDIGNKNVDTLTIKVDTVQ